MRARITYPSPTPKRQKKDYVAPPPILRMKLGNTDQQFFAFSTEESESEVQLGWVYGGVGEDAEMHLIRERRIKLEASNRGTITMNAMLNDFKGDILDVQLDGGRLLGYDLIHHGRVINTMLEKTCQTALQKQWVDFMRTGLDLSDPVISCWVLESRSKSSTCDVDTPFTLEDMMRMICPQHVIINRRRTALDHAALFIQMTKDLHELAKPPCRRANGNHKLTKIFISGQRDNNEFDWICSECGGRF